MTKPQAPMSAPDSHLRYALVETAILHARSLCDFFCNRKSDKYLTLADLADINQSPYPTLISDLKNAYNGQDKIRPREAFNEFVAHMTKKREKHARGYDYRPELTAIEQSLERMIEQIKSLFIPKPL